MIRYVFSDAGQLVIVFAACVLMAAGMVIEERARNRRLDRLDAGAAGRQQ